MSREEKAAEINLRMQQRAQIKRDIQDGVNAGLHLIDAAEAAGVPAAVVVANIATDPDFERWWNLSRDRMRMTQHEIPDNLSPTEIKEGVVRAAIRAGAVEKIGMIIAMADPLTPEGKRDLKDFALSIMRDHLPKEVKKSVEEVKSLTAEEAAAELEATTKEIQRLTMEIDKASRAYEEHGPETSGATEEAGGAEEEAY